MMSDCLLPPSSPSPPPCWLCLQSSIANELACEKVLIQGLDKASRPVLIVQVRRHVLQVGVRACVYHTSASVRTLETRRAGADGLSASRSRRSARRVHPLHRPNCSTQSQWISTMGIHPPHGPNCSTQSRWIITMGIHPPHGPNCSNRPRCCCLASTGAGDAQACMRARSCDRSVYIVVTH